jgi:hypothetical protein
MNGFMAYDPNHSDPFVIFAQLSAASPGSTYIPAPMANGIFPPRTSR